jgi:hypothetical protein
MNIRSFSLVAALALTSGLAVAVHPGVAQAQGLGGVPTHAEEFVNHWIYDAQGNIFGSVRRLTDGGQTAVIMVGAYFQPGSHEATSPTSALAMRNGKVTLEPTSVQALNTTTRR